MNLSYSVYKYVNLVWSIHNTTSKFLTKKSMFWWHFTIFITGQKWETLQEQVNNKVITRKMQISNTMLCRISLFCVLTKTLKCWNADFCQIFVVQLSQFQSTGHMPWQWNAPNLFCVCVHRSHANNPSISGTCFQRLFSTCFIETWCTKCQNTVFSVTWCSLFQWCPRLTG